jgi:hypothetical protein
LLWEDITDIAFLADFQLLRESRTDILTREWASPSIRMAVRAWQDLHRAQEEIKRVRIEALRLRTWIEDEEAYLQSKVQHHLHQSDELSKLLASELRVRLEYLQVVHDRIIKKLDKLDVELDGRVVPQMRGQALASIVLNAGPRLRETGTRDDVDTDQETEDEMGDLATIMDPVSM